MCNKSIDQLIFFANELLYYLYLNIILIPKLYINCNLILIKLKDCC
jgi:hypothetical protein